MTGISPHFPTRGRGPAAAVAALMAALSALGPAPADGQSVEARVQQAEEALEEARSSDLHLIAPRRFREAREKVAEARRLLERGGSISDIDRRLQEGRRALERARELDRVGHVLLGEAVQARSAALAAEATRHAPERWREAEEKLREAGREVEDGDQNDARERAAEAVRLYREAELQAIEASVLGEAREARRQADDADADERAPRTWSRADSLLRRAESLLSEDRTRREGASSLAREAARQFQHAVHIAELTRRHDRDGGIEELVLQAEEQLARIAASLDYDPRFHQGLEPATDEMLAAIRSIQEDQAALREQVAALQEELEGAGERTDSLRQRLAQLGERQAQTQAELEERRRSEQRLREIRAVFSEEEAEVAVSGDRLVIHLTGLRFPVGSAEIRPENFSLLTKLQRVLREFPDAPVEVQGHTDSRGDEEYNRNLSQRRAIAVREYLLANMAISADRVTTRGFGESRPIATNDTEDGRARNRRIDVVLELPEP